MTSVVRGMRQYRRCSTTSARVNDCEGKTDRSGQSTGPTSLTGHRKCGMDCNMELSYLGEIGIAFPCVWDVDWV